MNLAVLHFSVFSQHAFVKCVWLTSNLKKIRLHSQSIHLQFGTNHTRSCHVIQHEVSKCWITCQSLVPNLNYEMNLAVLHFSVFSQHAFVKCVWLTSNLKKIRLHSQSIHLQFGTNHTRSCHVIQHEVSKCCPAEWMYCFIQEWTRCNIVFPVYNRLQFIILMQHIESYDMAFKRYKLLNWRLFEASKTCLIFWINTRQKMKIMVLNLASCIL